ncbi:MAG: SsrA-binding protein SmpB, partial [Candidatus Nanoarchaeia archaeon]
MELAQNRKAFHEFQILERFEAGIELKGTEVKSCRMRNLSFNDAHVKYENGEIFLYGVHIAPYECGNRFNHDPLRPRKLLLHKSEIRKLAQKIKEKGLTIVPLKFYIKKRNVKV